MLLKDVYDLMRVRGEQKGLRVEQKSIGSIPIAISTDPTRLRQILLNLMGNAIKFTDSGYVRLVVRRILDRAGNDKISFEVEDSGIGIDKDHISRVFDPFGQATAATARKYGGTGLGLSLSKKLAGLLGGELTVKSTPGRGSAFTLLLPTRAAQESEVESRESTWQYDQPFVGSLTHRILLVEDGEDNQKLIRFMLQKAGAIVDVAADGQEGVDKTLAALQSDTPHDVVLMDMMMPVMDGYEATRRLREAGVTTPIIALTAYAMANDCRKCLDAGCDAYTTKPINRARLLAAIAAAAPQQCEPVKCSALGEAGP